MPDRLTDKELAGIRARGQTVVVTDSWTAKRWPTDEERQSMSSACTVADVGALLAEVDALRERNRVLEQENAIMIADLETVTAMHVATDRELDNEAEVRDRAEQALAEAQEWRRVHEDETDKLMLADQSYERRADKLKLTYKLPEHGSIEAVPLPWGWGVQIEVGAQERDKLLMLVPWLNESTPIVSTHDLVRVLGLPDAEALTDWVGDCDRRGRALIAERQKADA